MIAPTQRHWLIIAALAVLVMVGALVAALHLAALALKVKVEQALGPNSEVAEVRVSWSAVEVLGVRIRAPRVGKGGWPAEDELRAERVVIVPELRELLSSATVRVRSIAVEGGYLAVLRAKDGRLRLVPGLLDRGTAQDKKGLAGPAIFIGAIALRDCAVEFFDATISQPALKVRVEQLEAKVQDVRLPELTGKTRLTATGIVKGGQRDGTVSLNGSVELASKNSDIALRLRRVDLVSLQPYLIKASESAVRRGSLDLDVTSTVRNNRLHAPGSLTLTGLELTSAGGGTFMGVPRSAVVSLLKDGNDRINLSFVLDGDLSDPRFSLNENFATRIGSSLAGTLGISLEGLAREVGSAGGNVLRGVGDAVEKLLGR